MVAGEAIAAMLANHKFSALENNTYNIVIPVPLHKRRLRKRGFNQPLILAKALSKQMGVPLDFVALARIRDTVPQVGLSGNEREKTSVAHLQS